MVIGTNSFTGKILTVDLTDRSVKEYIFSDEDRSLFLGNKGIGAKILYDNLAAGLDPLSADNCLVLSTAILTGTGAPCSYRFNVSTKSPLTGLILSSNCGGNFGVELKKSGLDALVITGSSDRPVYIVIEDEDVQIKSADGLWGDDTQETQVKLEEIYGKKIGQLVIGPAGENLVRYACMISGERAIGRGGAGAVAGSKNLKGIIAKGSRKVEVADKPRFKKAIKNWTKLLQKHPTTGKTLPSYGTASLVMPANNKNVLPTRNFEYRNYKDAYEISGENLADKHLVKNSGCRACPIRCGRVVKVDGKDVKGPEFETIGMFGSNIDNSDLSLINSWNVVMDKLGMDSISAGGSIAFAMEATEKGLIKSDLQFGKMDNIEKHLYDIAYRRGVGNDLAEGAMRLSEKFGGKEFAVHSKGMEFAAYDPRGSVGHGLGYATANRGGCHLNAGYMVYFEALGPVNLPPTQTWGKAPFTVLQQNLFEAVSCCGTCIFTTYAAIPAFASKLPQEGIFASLIGWGMLASAPFITMLLKIPSWLLPVNLPQIPYSGVVKHALGNRMTFGRFMDVGARVFNLERMFNVREGMVLDELPQRTEIPLLAMLGKYYSVRGWDVNGVPTAATLKRYNLSFAKKDLPEADVAKQDLIDRFMANRNSYEKKQQSFIQDRIKANKNLK